MMWMRVFCRPTSWVLIAVFLNACSAGNKNEVKISKYSENTMDFKIIRDFTLSPQVLFDAFTQPRSMKSWCPENTRYSINIVEMGEWSIGIPVGNHVFYYGGFIRALEAPNHIKISYIYKSLEYNLNPLQFPERDSIIIDIEETDLGSSMTFIDRRKINNLDHQLNKRNIGDSFTAGISWETVFDLIEKRMKEDRYQVVSNNLPDDLEVIYYKQFKGIFYDSSDGRIFADIYYESGSFQGSVIFELTEDEKKQFEVDKDGFLDTYSNKVSAGFRDFMERRHIYEFRNVVNTAKLVRDWQEKN